ncbi:MAG: hypothetical protein QXS54_11820 [Candidatus Methanomethylicaceae archaeon]
MDKRSALFTLLRPHPLGIVLTVLLILTLQKHSEYMQVIPVGTVYLILLNSTFNLKKIRLGEPEIFTTQFLLAFAKCLQNSSPETAFLRALNSETALKSGLKRAPKKGFEIGSKLRLDSRSKSEPKNGSPLLRLVPVVWRIRNVVPLSDALKQIRGLDGTDALLPDLLSDLLSFSSEEASRRICNYARYRQEKERLKSALSIKLAVVSLRFRVLSLICSSSLAVIAFASPILYSMAGLSQIGFYSSLNTMFSFDAEVAFICLSVAVFSTYAYSKLLPDLSGLRLSIASAILFLATEVALLLIIGWRI